MTFRAKVAIGGVIFLLLVSLATAGAALETVDEGHEKVLKEKGDSQRSLEPGDWHMINPVTQSTVSVDMRPQKMEFTDRSDKGERKGDNSIKVITADDVRVPVNLQVTYMVTDSKTFYETWKNHDNFRERALHPGVEDGILEVGGGTNSSEIATDQGRAAMRKAAMEELEQRTDGTGAVVNSVSIKKVDLPNEITNAAQRAQAKDQELEAKKKEQKIASAEAERKKIEAEGDREAMMIRAEAYKEEGVLEAHYVDNLDKTESILVPIGPNGTPVFMEGNEMMDGNESEDSNEG